tara:strand:+ start:172 stop:960 length:789 start_codon:yes stop_codon:yes gene_type:complete
MADAPVIPPTPEQDDEGMMTLREHLVEFRTRLTISVLAVIVASMAFWPVREHVFDLLQQPLPDNVQLQQIAPTESFFAFVRVSIFGGLGIASPLIIYQILAFVSPGLYSSERRLLYVSIPAVAAMFILGVLFCWFVVLRFTLGFLTQFSPEDIPTQLSIDNHVNFVSRMLLIVGLVFETPFVIFLLAKLRIIKSRTLQGLRRYAIVVIVILAAVITPTPDPFTQMSVAIPMYLLYEMGVLLARIAVPDDETDESASQQTDSE